MRRIRIVLLPCVVRCWRAAARCRPAAAGAKTRRGGRAGSACALRPPMRRAIPGSGRRSLGAVVLADRRLGSAHSGLGARAHARIRLAAECRRLERRSARPPRSSLTTPTIVATPGGDDFGEWLAEQGQGHARRCRGRQRDGCDHALAQDGSRSRAAERPGRRELPFRPHLDFRRPHPPRLPQPAFDRHVERRATHARRRPVRADDRHVLVAHRGRLAFSADTLFSMALGNFMASFVNDAFLGLDAPTVLHRVRVAAMPDGAMRAVAHALAMSAECAYSRALASCSSSRPVL